MLSDDFCPTNPLFEYIADFVNRSFKSNANKFRFNSLVEHIMFFWPSSVFQPIIDYYMDEPSLLLDKNPPYFSKSAVMLMRSQSDEFFFNFLKKLINNKNSNVLQLCCCKYGNFLMKEIFLRQWTFRKTVVERPNSKTPGFKGVFRGDREFQSLKQIPDSVIISRKIWIYNLKINVMKVIMSNMDKVMTSKYTKALVVHLLKSRDVIPYVTKAEGGKG